MNILIVGAGGMGREVFSWMVQSITDKSGYRVKGFLDDNPEALGGRAYPISVIGSIVDYRPKDDENLVLSILDPKIKKRIADTLLDKGANFYTLIHPSAILGTNITIGKGSVICPNCIVTNDVTIGDFVFLNTSSTLGHDSVIGNYSSINGKVEITGNVVVGRGCLFGVGAKVIPGRKIGDGATVGAGSVVIRNVPPGITVFGNPAKKI